MTAEEKAGNKVQYISESEYGELLEMLFPEDEDVQALLIAMIDESQTNENAPVIAVGGGVGVGKQWARLLKDWCKALGTERVGIFHTSDVIALDDHSFKGKYKAPRSNVNDQELLAVARSFAANGLADKSRFLDYDLPADFLDTHNAAIEDFEQAVNQQNEGAATRKGARVSLEDALTRAEEELERCDTALRNRIKDAGILSAWESARRLERAPQKQKAKPSTATATAEK